MEALSEKRARLRRELEEAYGAWLTASEVRASTLAAHAPIDTSGCPQATKAKWFDYLAARERLVLAYAEKAAAT